jgi:DNA gyrase/topoisomerase IV subunit A
VDVINYHDFVNKELILFSMADLARSIPSAIDGFKPGQRKILFGCFKHKVKKSVKVRGCFSHGLFPLQGVPLTVRAAMLRAD